MASAPRALAEEETVTVTGRRAPDATGDPTVASRVVRGEPLVEPGSDAGRVLSRTPGVQVTRTGTSADVTTLSLRGSDSAEVPVYIAGIRINDDLAGVADLSRVPLWMLDRAEVYRGSAPASVDGVGLSGAVLFEPRLPSKNEARVGLIGGSYDTYGGYAGGSVASQSGPSEVGAASSFSIRHDSSAGDYTFKDDRGTGFDPSDDGTSTRTNADYTQTDVWSLSRFTLPSGGGPSTISVLLNSLGREQGVTGLSPIQATAARSELSRQLFGLSSKTPCVFGKAPCTLTASTSFRKAELTTTDPLGEIALGAPWVSQDAGRMTGQLGLAVQEEELLEWQLRAAYEAASFALDEPGVHRTRANESRISGTGAVVTRGLPVTLQGLLRASCVDVTGSFAGEPAQSSGQCLPEAKLGAEYKLLAGLRLRANGSRGVRIPSLGERYGASATVRGTPDLKVESGWAGDLGVLYEGNFFGVGTFWLEGFGYGRFSDDLIALQRSALGYVRPYNVGTARFLGAEVTGEVDVLSHFRLQAGVSPLDPRDTTEGRTTQNDLVPFRSRLTATGQAEIYANLKGGGIQRAGLTFYVDYRSGRVADPAGLIVIPQQTTADLALSALVLEGALALRARVENLFNAANYDALGFPLPGQSFFLGAELTLD